jgi:hypothetical protein
VLALLSQDGEQQNRSPYQFRQTQLPSSSVLENSSVIEKILRHLKLWAPPERPPPPRSSTTLEYDADFLAWQAAGRLFDGID